MTDAVVSSIIGTVNITSNVETVAITSDITSGGIGFGVVSGGTASQVLWKLDGTDYNTGWHTLAKADVGLGNADNTSDSNKPVSTAQQAELDMKSDKAIAATGAEISFATAQIYNSVASPSAANITDDLAGAAIGVVQKIYHKHSIAPTFPAGWVKLGSGEYSTTELNIIYCEWVSALRVEYWIVQ